MSSGPRAFTPAAELMDPLVAELRRHTPFTQMALADVQAFITAAQQRYYAPTETLLQPADGPVTRLLYIRRGAVSGQLDSAVARPETGAGQVGIHCEAGDLFPAAAVVAERAVSARYTALDDTFCLEVDAAFARRLAETSAPFADYLTQRVRQLLSLSRQALQAEQGARALEEQALEAPLSLLPRKQPVACGPATSLLEVLRLMQARRVGSVLVLDGGGRAQGIFTRHDVLERVALARPPEHTPIAQLMTAPVQTLDLHASAQDAALLMSRHGIRHLPLTDGDGERVVSMVSERDLFALQRQSLKQIGGVIRGAADSAALVHAAGEIRLFARLLLAQGLTARVLTEMLSHLNDLLTERLLQITAAAHGLDLGRAAWLAFGSEGRSEQTIATDQDNGLVLADNVDAAEHARWLALGQAVNLALAECGYPLCTGNVMAGNPECCLTLQGWSTRFAHWMDQGAPVDLLKASIYFDLRPLAGAKALAWPLRELITQRAQELPRFRKQLADNALNRRPPLNWRGGLETLAEGDAAWLDLKLGGSAIFVDAARLLALAHGVAATPTRERLQGAGLALHMHDKDIGDWLGAFDALQMFRLRQQVRPGLDPARPNHIDVKALSTLDRRLLKESLRVAQALQQRLEMDYAG